METAGLQHVVLSIRYSEPVPFNQLLIGCPDHMIGLVTFFCQILRTPDIGPDEDMVEKPEGGYGLFVCFCVLVTLYHINPLPIEFNKLPKKFELTLTKRDI